MFSNLQDLQNGMNNSNPNQVYYDAEKGQYYTNGDVMSDFVSNAGGDQSKAMQGFANVFLGKPNRNYIGDASGSSKPSVLTDMLAKAKEAYTTAQNTNPMDMSKLFPNLSSPYAQSSVADMYQNILGRAPDTEGLNYWTQKFGNQVNPQETQQFLAGIKDYTTANNIDGYRQQYGDAAANQLAALQNSGYTYNQPQTLAPQYAGSSGAGRFAGGLLSK